MNSISKLSAAFVFLTILSGCGPEGAPVDVTKADERPNILLIVADDLGYTDLGAYGGEIDTPNIDALAGNGVMFSQFYASPMCSPSRAMLLTGVDHHRVGLGSLASRLADNQRGQPGYEGYLTRNVTSLPERLKEAGYRNYFSGKWHLGHENGADPESRAFDRSFALHDSGGSHFANRMSLSGPEKILYTENGKPVEALPNDFYSTRFYTDKMIEYLDEDRGDDRPFFAYLAFSAPHFPLQAPPEAIEEYSGRYDAGYDVLHQQRLSRAQALNLVPGDIPYFAGAGVEADWSDLSEAERRSESRTMEIYAAMVDLLDANVGRLLAHLQDQGVDRDTLVVFLSDNGAEGHRLHHGLDPLHEWSKICCDNTLDNMGSDDSYVMLGPRWARASMAPFRMFKGFTSEGGVRVPMIVSFPKGFEGKRVFDGIATIVDLAPTILELAGAPSTGMELDGRSLLPVLRTDGVEAHSDEAAFGWELLGKSALRQGDWKIVRESPFSNWWDAESLGIKRNEWQLYNIASDPAETIDLATEHPERLQRMSQLWLEYAERNGVILPDTGRSY